MRNIFISLVICCLSAAAQDIDPQPIVFDVPGIGDTTLSPGLFPADRFILGWQWNASARISDNLLSNMKQDHYPFWKQENYDTNYKMLSVMGSTQFHIHSQALQYEPTLKIEIPGGFYKRENDPMKSVF